MIPKSEKSSKDLIWTKMASSQKVCSGMKLRGFFKILLSAVMLEVIETSAGFVQDKMAEAKKCLEEMDVDNDGQVSYPEFLLVWKSRD